MTGKRSACIFALHIVVLKEYILTSHHGHILILHYFYLFFYQAMPLEVFLRHLLRFMRQCQVMSPTLVHIICSFLIMSYSMLEMDIIPIQGCS